MAEWEILCLCSFRHFGANINNSANLIVICVSSVLPTFYMNLKEYISKTDHVM
jgi:peroxiredoxin